MATLAQFAHHPCWLAFLICAAVGPMTGCAQRDQRSPPSYQTARVLALAPVLNLSGSQDFDPLKMTDLIASEFLSFEGVAIVPVNLTLAELERRGKRAVETPEDAIALAKALRADATVVIAVTEYNPYYPPVIGLIMQWYEVRPSDGHQNSEPHVSKNSTDDVSELSDYQCSGLRRQIQRVFNAADEKTLAQVHAYAEQRGGQLSPYSWKKYVESQELYVRYCGWELIRTMLRLESIDRTATRPNEANS